MYEGNPNVLTASDIEEVRANGASAIALPDGRDAIPVLLVLTPECSKVYGVGPGVTPMPAQLHLTNGIWHKLLDITPLPVFENVVADRAATTDAVAATEPEAIAEPEAGLSEPVSEPVIEADAEAENTEDVSAD